MHDRLNRYVQHVTSFAQNKKQTTLLEGYFYSPEILNRGFLPLFCKVLFIYKQWLDVWLLSLTRLFYFL
jgi:hypothetical protein